jgi:hypothetical protein
MKHKDQNGQDLRQLLKQNIPPASHSELRRDLWPQMLEKLSRESVPSANLVAQTSHVPWPRIHWFDWVLAAVAGAAVLFFPAIIPALLYHL